VGCVCLQMPNGGGGDQITEGRREGQTVRIAYTRGYIYRLSRGGGVYRLNRGGGVKCRHERERKGGGA